MNPLNAAKTARSLIETIVFVVCASLICAAAYRWGHSTISADIYRTRLEELAQDCDKLRSLYNEAVRHTAVTEMHVRNGKVFVVVRTVEGELETIPVDVDPNAEVYVDYALIDGRIWIRRVFDANTPPSEAAVIAPKLAHIDWESHESSFGKAVYRQLAEGRWRITVSGNGALGLARVEEGAPIAVQTPPQITPFPELIAATEAKVTAIGPRDVWRWGLGRLSGQQE